MSAAAVSGVGLYVVSWATRAERRSSGSATAVAIDVVLTSSSVLPARGASTWRTAWGRTTENAACQALSPVERAASVWPRGTASIPARKISP